MTDLLVYAIGDSIMWGEGLIHKHKFAMRVATSLAEARGLTPVLQLRAHCGATIKSTRDQRARFADTFPHLFTSEQRNRFLVPDDDTGNGPTPDESPTDLPMNPEEFAESVGRHGEIPRAFPTIPYQLRNIPDKDAQRIDVLLVNGGANDLDFQKALQQGGDFLKALDARYQSIFHDDIMTLLEEARQKCPRALIVLTGYYSAFSLLSEFNGMRDLFLELTGKARDYKFWRAIPTLGPFVLELSGTEALIEKAVNLARANSEAGESRAHYWMRRAVTEINEDPALAPIRGPGVTFAAPGFLYDNCMFAENSLIWQKYTNLDDDAQTVRKKMCPRSESRNDMEQVLNAIFGLPTAVVVSWETVKNLGNTLDGPHALRVELWKLAGLLEANRNVWGAGVPLLAPLLKAEIARIDITLSSSLSHPNREGAERYSAVVHKRAEQLRQPISVRERLRHFLPPSERSAPPEALSLGQMIRRFGFGLGYDRNQMRVWFTRPAIGVRACLAHAEPDVLGLHVITHSKSDPITREIFLNLGVDMRWNLRRLLKETFGDFNVNPHLRPGEPDHFTIDVAGQISIGDITQAVLEFEEELVSEQWVPDSIALSIDGRYVLQLYYKFSVHELPPVTSSLNLGFPIPG